MGGTASSPAVAEGSDVDHGPPGRGHPPPVPARNRGPRDALPAWFPPFRPIAHTSDAWPHTGGFSRRLDARRGLARDQAGRSQVVPAAALDRPAGAPLLSQVHEASLQERNGALEGSRMRLEQAPQGAPLWADGGSQGPKLASARAECRLGGSMKSGYRPRPAKGFPGRYRRGVVERPFAGRVRGWRTFLPITS